eukprot:g3665.t1
MPMTLQDQIIHLSVALSSIFLRKDTPYEIIGENIGSVLSWFAHSGPKARGQMIRCFRDVIAAISVGNLSDSIPIVGNDHSLMSKLRDCARHAGNIDVEKAFSVSVDGEFVPPNALVAEVQLCNVFQDAADGTLKPIRFTECVRGTSVVVKSELLDTVSLRATVVGNAKEVRSFWSGSSFTCKVRYVPRSPRILAGIDPESDNAMLTVSANVKLPAIGSRDAVVQIDRMNTHLHLDRGEILGGDGGRGVSVYSDPAGLSSKDDETLVRFVLGVNGIVARVGARVRLVTLGLMSSKWDATYTISDAEFRGGRLRVPFLLYACEKTGLRARVDGQSSIRFRQTSGPNFRFEGTDAEAKQYSAVTSFLSTGLPMAMSTIESKVSGSIQKSVAGKDFCVLPWDLFDLIFLEGLGKINGVLKSAMFQ